MTEAEEFPKDLSPSPPPPSSSPPTEEVAPLQTGLTLGAVREVFIELAGPADDAKIKIKDLPKALEILGVPTTPEEVDLVLAAQVEGGMESELGLASYVAFLQSVTKPA